MFLSVKNAIYSSRKPTDRLKNIQFTVTEHDEEKQETRTLEKLKPENIFFLQEII